MKKLILSIIGLILIILTISGIEKGTTLGFARGSLIVALDSSPVKFYFIIGFQLIIGVTLLLHAFGVLKDK